MREGIDVIRDTPVVRRITLTTLCWNLAFYGSEALIVPFLRDVIDLDGRHVGWVLGVGSLIGIATGPVILWLEGRTSAAAVIVTGIVVERPVGARSGGLDAPSGRCSRSGSC